jgi:hypothetical protein
MSDKSRARLRHAGTDTYEMPALIHFDLITYLVFV